MNIPKFLLPWLTYTKFLTKRLHAISGNTRIEVLNEGTRLTNWWERYKLNLGFESIFIREIIAYANSDACWYARTIIPCTTYNEHINLFAELGAVTLGDLIFGDNQIERSFLKSYAITSDNIEFYFPDKDLLKSTKTLWMRISEFIVMQKNKFYLIEIFLPDLEKYS